MALTNKLASSGFGLDAAVASRNIPSVEQEFQVSQELGTPAPANLPANGTTAATVGQISSSGCSKVSSPSR
jgi:hypothetical protein